MINKYLNCFVCVAETKNFSKAAQQLFLTPSAVTLQIKSLEEYLGFGLFVRNNRSVRLTPAGEAFYKEVKQILQLTEHAIRSSREIAGVRRTYLNIGVWGSDCYTILPLICSAFLQKHPQISLEYINMRNSLDQFDDLRKGSVDLFVKYGCANRIEKGLRFSTLFHDDIICLLPAHHRLASLDYIKPSDLCGEKWIAPWTNVSSFHDQLRNYIYANVPDVQVLASQEYDASIMMLQSLPGFMLCPRSLAIQNAHFISKPFELEQKVSIDLITRNSHDPLIEEFIKLGQQACRQAPMSLDL